MGATRLERTPEMAPDQLSITLSEQGTTTTISLAGEWDLAQQRAIRNAINKVLARFPECVVLDLSELSFIDSTGIHGIFELHKRAEQQNARLVIVPGPQAVQHIFELLGLTEALPFLTGRTRLGEPRDPGTRDPALRDPAALSPPSATPAAKGPSGRRR